MVWQFATGTYVSYGITHC